MSNLSAAPALEVTCLKTASAVGLRQMFPRHTNKTRVLPSFAAIIEVGVEGSGVVDSGSRDRFRAWTAAAAALDANALPRTEADRGADPGRPAFAGTGIDRCQYTRQSLVCVTCIVDATCAPLLRLAESMICRARTINLRGIVEERSKRCTPEGGG